MAEIDHLVLVVPDLELAIDEVERDLGIRPEVGGRHDGMGTWNALLALDREDLPACYLELIAADPTQPDPTGPRPFGIDDDDRRRLVTFAARPNADESIDGLVTVLRTHGHDPGDPVPMARTTPTGGELRWRLTFPTMAAGGVVPFLIDWGDTPNPATTIGTSASLTRFDATVPAEVSDLLGALALPGLDTAARSAPGQGPGLTAELRGPSGTITL
ncbi:MAG: VOC family protein [Actinomycetota bacterium]